MYLNERRADRKLDIAQEDMEEYMDSVTESVLETIYNIRKNIPHAQTFTGCTLVYHSEMSSVCVYRLGADLSLLVDSLSVQTWISKSWCIYTRAREIKLTERCLHRHPTLPCSC